MDRYATSGDDIYAARVSSTGTMLDPAGIAVSSAPGNQHNPRVAFDGTNFLVVWETDGDDADIHGARLGPDGQVLAPGEFEITAAEGDQRASSVAFNGAGYIVLWADERSGTSSDIYGVRVTTGGVVERTGDSAVATTEQEETSPQLAGTGTVLAAWSASENIVGARITSAGVVQDAAGIVISNAADSQTSPAVSYDGTNYVVVWEDLRSGDSHDVFGTRVSGAGAVLDASGIPISASTVDEDEPTVAFDGTSHVVLWTDGGATGRPVRRASAPLGSRLRAR